MIDTTTESPDNLRSTVAYPRILVSKVGPVGYSETFIRAHAQRLPKVVGLHDGTPPVDPRIYQGLMRRIGWQGPGIRSRSYWQGILRATAPDVVLAEHGQTAVSMMSACKSMDIPLVAHFHGSDAWVEGTVRGYRHTYPRLFKLCAAIVVPSCSMERQLLKLGAPSAKLRLVRCGVDMATVEPGTPATTPPHFVSVGRFVEVKGHTYVIRAFAHAYEQRPDARLTIFGDGPLYAECKELASRLGLGEALTFAGVQDHKTICEALRHARALVNHSICTPSGSREGAPVVIAEAQAAGLPVISTPTGGIPELVQDSVNGFICPERDVHSLTQAIVSLIDGPSWAEELGRAGRARVERDQDVAVTTQALSKVLAEAHEAHDQRGQRNVAVKDRV